MGHVLTNEGIKVDSEKAKAIINTARPAHIEGVQQLNSFVNYRVYPCISRPFKT